MTREEVKQSIVEQCLELGVDEILALSIARIESSYNAYAIRYEPNFRYSLAIETYAKQNILSYDTEKALQSMSIGPMQVMGLIIREMSFKGNLAEVIANPKLGIRYGLLKLRSLVARYENEDHVISSYNAGSVRKIDGKFSNQAYVDKVKVQLNKLRNNL